METVAQDIKYALRSLLRSPGFAAAAVLSLALGIGANTAIFTLADRTLLRPLSTVDEPERLVAVYTAKQDDRFAHTGYADFVDYREMNRAFTGLAAYASSEFTLKAGGSTLRVTGQLASDEYFSVLGVQPQIGRVFRAGAGAAGIEVAVIGHGLWTRLFGSDPAAIGSTVELNGKVLTIIGVAPPGFRGLDLSVRPEIWVPLSLASDLATGFYAQFQLADYEAQRHGDRRIAWLAMVGRLSPEMELAGAESAMRTVARRLARMYPRTNADKSITLVPARADATPFGSRADLEAFLSLLFGVVVLVLLIACANVANLLLVRATTRSQEIGIRLALGAGRFRLVRQLVTESLILAGLGGAVGVVGALWALDALSAFQLPGGIAIGSLGFELDAQVLAFTAALSIATGIVFGLVPAVQATRSNPASTLRTRDPASERSRLRSALVTLQIAVCLVLLLGAGLFLRSLRNGLTTELGFERERLLMASVELGPVGYDEARAALFYRTLLERLESIPGIRSATVTSAPFGDRAFGVSGIELADRPAPPGEEEVRKHLNFVGPDYVGTMGLRLLRGRDLALRDFDRDGSSAAVISQAMARRYWPGADPIGKRFRFGPSGSFFEVVGVVANSKHEDLRRGEDFIYAYLAAGLRRPGETSVVLRADGDPRRLAEPLRDAVRSLDPGVPVSDLATIEDRLGTMLMPQRMGSTLLSLLGALALGLALVGIYGVVAFTVSRRTREIGIRMALGAERSDLLGHFVARGLVPVAVGILLGLGAAAVLARFASSFLFEVGTTDTVTFVAVSLALTAVALSAVWVPASKATRVDPATALRDQ